MAVAFFFEGSEGACSRLYVIISSKQFLLVFNEKLRNESDRLYVRL